MVDRAGNRLVPDQEHLLPIQAFQRLLLRQDGPGDLQDEQDETCRLGFLPRFLDPDPLREASRVPQARGVDEPDADPLEFHRLVEDIPGGPRLAGDDGPRRSY